MVGRWDQPIFAASRPASLDLPVVIVQEEMVVFAEQDSVGHVGAATVSGPVVDVVGFAPGWWSFAAGPTASTVAFGKGRALAGCEESLLATHVERLAVLVEDDGDGALSAGETFDGFDRDRLLGSLQTPVSGAGDELLFGDRDADGGSSVPQQLARLHLGAGCDQLEEDVGRQLLRGARIVDHLLRSFGVGDETGTAAAG